jgi:regulator of protease activity HflC (stomatin/prohibitin superfamily)
MAVCLWEITNNIRRRYLKYKDELTEEQLNVAEDIFSDINHELDRWGINLDDIIE